MNVWRRGLLVENPYVRTAFRVARVPREITRRQTLVQYIGQTRAMLGADPQSHVIRGTAVTQQELNRAEAILLSAEDRILEELLTHAAESLRLRRIRQLIQEATEVMAPDQESSGPPDRRALARILRELIRLYLCQAQGAQAEFGALELELPAPFEWKEKE
jgi:hypothetical protein